MSYRLKQNRSWNVEANGDPPQCRNPFSGKRDHSLKLLPAQLLDQELTLACLLSPGVLPSSAP